MIKWVQSFPIIRLLSSRRALPIASFPCSQCKRECTAEFIGTYVLVLLGPGSIILLSLISVSGFEALALIALTFGGTVGLLILLFGKYSGTVINPAITFAAVYAKLLRRDLFVPYLFFQLTGGLLAGLTLRYLFLSIDTTSLGSTKLASGINPVLGITIEAVGTFFLTFSALLASSKLKRTHHQALLVGTTLFVLILFIGPLTGAGFNPARSLGPALASGYIENLYVYFIGPIFGAIVAGVVFEVTRRVGKRDSVCMR